MNGMYFVLTDLGGAFALFCVAVGLILRHEEPQPRRRKPPKQIKEKTTGGKGLFFKI